MSRITGREYMPTCPDQPLEAVGAIVISTVSVICKWLFKRGI